MSKSKYKSSYPGEILAYFRSFLGYWERRLEAAEERLAAEAWQQRAEAIAKRHAEAFERGEAVVENVAELLDPENIKQAARVQAYHAIMEEMTAKRRLQGLPELVKWATRIGVTMTTLREWRDKYPKFDEACRECMEIQRVLLKDGGLSGVYAGKTVTFLLQYDHGMRVADEGQGEDESGLVVHIDHLKPKEERADDGDEKADV